MYIWTEDGLSDTPQQGMSVEFYQSIMNHQGSTNDREAEALAFERSLTLYKQFLGKDITVLELGVGLGNMAHRLAAVVGRENYIGCESNLAFLNHAQTVYPGLCFLHKNFFDLAEAFGVDVICIPYSTVTLFTFKKQQRLIEKALKHAPCLMIQTTLPDVHGVKEDTVHRLKNDIGLPCDVLAFFMTEESYKVQAHAHGARIFDRYDYDAPYTKQSKKGVFRNTLLTLSR